MSSYMLRGLPPGLVGRAKERARADGTTLDAVLLRYLQIYEKHGNPQAKGARAANEARTPEERSEAARKAVEARWHKARQGE